MSEHIPQISSEVVAAMHRNEVAELLRKIDEIFVEIPEQRRRDYFRSRHEVLDFAGLMMHQKPSEVSKRKVADVRKALALARQIQADYPVAFGEAAQLFVRIDEIDQQHGWQSY